MHQIIATIEADVKSRPAAIEFEMAYQVRIAVERIKFAIKHTEQFGKPSGPTREASLQLLDALDRLEAVDRRFPISSSARSVMVPTSSQRRSNLKNSQRSGWRAERPSAAQLCPATDRLFAAD
jgi:hypothetical protein